MIVLITKCHNILNSKIYCKFKNAMLRVSLGEIRTNGLDALRSNEPRTHAESSSKTYC